MATNLRYEMYRWARRFITYRQWETYYAEIVRNGNAVSSHYLHELLSYAREHVPYYSSLPDKVETLEHVPILSKPLIARNFEALKSDELDRHRWFVNSSGGSTGRPQTFVQDKVFQQWGIATQVYFHRAFLGIEYPRVRKVVLWGSERDIFNWRRGLKPRVSNWLTQTTFLNSFKISRDTMLEYIDVINKKKPVYLKGYASSLYELASIAKQSGRKIHSPRIVYSSAETLRPHMREVIEDVFGCKVYDFYGSREVGAIAGECRSGKLHVFEFNNAVEVVDGDGKPVAPGDEGRLLVTTLHNRSMPLVRYEIGDTAIKGSPCDCGSPLATLERVTGRVSDHFLTTRGDIVHGEYFTHLFYYRDWVDEFQVLQTDVDRIVVYYVGRGDENQDEIADIDAKIRLVMGENCAIEWKRVKEIPRTPQGKMLYTRSLVTQGERR